MTYLELILPCLSFSIQGYFLLLFSSPTYLSAPAPYPFVYTVPILTVPISHPPFNIFQSHLALTYRCSDSSPLFSDLCSATRRCLLTQTSIDSVKPHLLQSSHHLRVLILALLLSLLQGFFPSKFTLSQRNGAHRVLPALVAQSKLNRIICLFVFQMMMR